MCASEGKPAWIKSVEVEQLILAAMATERLGELALAVSQRTSEPHQLADRLFDGFGVGVEGTLGEHARHIRVPESDPALLGGSGFVEGGEGVSMGCARDDPEYQRRTQECAQFR